MSDLTKLWAISSDRAGNVAVVDQLARVKVCNLLGTTQQQLDRARVIVRCVNMNDVFLETCAKARADIGSWVNGHKPIKNIRDNVDDVYVNLKDLFELLESALDQHAGAKQ